MLRLAAPRMSAVGMFADDARIGNRRYDLVSRVIQNVRRYGARRQSRTSTPTGDRRPSPKNSRSSRSRTPARARRSNISWINNPCF